MYQMEHLPTSSPQWNNFLVSHQCFDVRNGKIIKYVWCLLTTGMISVILVIVSHKHCMLFVVAIINATQLYFQ